MSHVMVEEREIDAEEVRMIREDITNAMEDAAMNYELRLDSVRSIVVRIFTREELLYALGRLT